MTKHVLTLASAFTFALLLPAIAAEKAPRAMAPQTFSIPPVIGAGLHNFAVATTPDEVQRQGGYALPISVKWLPAASRDVDAARTFSVPAVIGAGFHQFAVATTPDEVQRQGGYALPVAVKWLPAAPSIVATTSTIKVGSL